MSTTEKRSVTSAGHEMEVTTPSRLVLRRLGIDTYQEHIVYMHADCHVCRSEGFEARSRVRVSTNGASLLATLNVIRSELLGLEEASLSEAAWTQLGAHDGDVIEITHPEPIESESFVRAKAYGERLSQDQLSAIVGDIAKGLYSELHLAAFVTACAGNRLDIEETIGLTRAMIGVGERMSWPYPVVADKHCVGGLPGNRTTPIVVAPPGITYRSDPKHGVYRIRSPKPGLWSYVVQPHDLTAEFFAIASGPTLLAARLGPSQLERTAGGFAIPLRVWVADRKAVQNALVDGHVRQPNGVKVPVALLDDGAHDDGAAGDAIYGLRYLASLPGAYSVELRVTGTSNAGEPFERHLATSFVVPGQQKRPVQYGEGLPGRPGSRLCNCASDARYSVAFFGGRTFPTGAFNSIADSSYSLGAKAAFHFAGPGGRWSAGLYLGRDNFTSATGAADYRLTHLSPELEFTPALQVCPIPSLHAGVGAYRNESGNVKVGYNLGASLSICLADRTNLLLRYDFRSVNGFSRDYSTLQLGMRFRF